MKKNSSPLSKVLKVSNVDYDYLCASYTVSFTDGTYTILYEKQMPSKYKLTSGNNVRVWFAENNYIKYIAYRNYILETFCPQDLSSATKQDFLAYKKQLNKKQRQDDEKRKVIKAVTVIKKIKLTQTGVHNAKSVLINCLKHIKMKLK